jgi:hypothetical protein
MKRVFKGKLVIVISTMLTLAAMTVAQPLSTFGKGGSGGGGSNKTVEYRVTGYITAIDYENSKIEIGASYYGSGMLEVTSDTSISFDNNSCSLEDLQMGDWVEARYVSAFDSLTGRYVLVATKLAATSIARS